MPHRLFPTAAVLLTLISAPAQPQGAGSALDDSLSRMSEILGALHYLRGLCEASEGSRWRNEMQNLIEAEGTTPERKTRMVANFNRGFQGFQQTYRTCTPAADLAIRRYLAEGAKLSREITARYSN
jgi:uncharacterized protein (TIGR02301 family)